MSRIEFNFRQHENKDGKRDKAGTACRICLQETHRGGAVAGIKGVDPATTWLYQHTIPDMQAAEAEGNENVAMSLKANTRGQH